MASIKLQSKDLAVFSTSDKSAIIESSPHCTNERFRIPQTVFCSEPGSLVDLYGRKHIPNLRYEYSDNLRSWDYKKDDMARLAADKSVGNSERYTARWHEVYLSEYFEASIELVHLIAGYNLSNGFPYQVYGFRTRDQTT